jgi:NhaB family Na+:H+ antiporter
VRKILVDFDKEQRKRCNKQDVAKLIIQVLIAVWLIIGLMFHLAEVGLIGLSVIILATAFTGVIEEHSLGKAFGEALPFTAVLALEGGVITRDQFDLLAVAINTGTNLPSCSC